MGGGTRLKRTHQGPLTPGFNKMEGVFNSYMEPTAALADTEVYRVFKAGGNITSLGRIVFPATSRNLPWFGTPFFLVNSGQP